MDKLSDRLDFFDKGIEIHNYYIQIEAERIRDEIIRLDHNSNDINKLRVYFANFLGRERISQLSDADIRDLLVIRANDLYRHYLALSGQKIDTTPLKIIVQGLKIQGN